MAPTSPLVHEQRPDRFTMTCGTVTASIEFRPETLSDLLRRLQPVLVGGRDPSGQLGPLALLREVGTRLWKELLPDSLSDVERENLLLLLHADSTPLLLALPPSLAGLPWELLYDPQQPDDTGFVARKRPLVRLVPGDTHLLPLAPPLRVLLLISSPPGLDVSHQVDVESERAAVESAVQSFREMGLLHLQVEDRVTVRRVQQALLRFKPHLLHYIGHGTYDERQGGFLF